MDWIEQWFGLSPDNGDGSLEVFIVVCGVTIAVMICLAHPRMRSALAELLLKMKTLVQ